jgi:hypothetical protein
MKLLPLWDPNFVFLYVINPQKRLTMNELKKLMAAFSLIVLLVINERFSFFI